MVRCNGDIGSKRMDFHELPFIVLNWFNRIYLDLMRFAGFEPAKGIQWDILGCVGCCFYLKNWESYPINRLFVMV